MRALLPTVLVVSILGLGVACGSDPAPAPATPFAVGPSGGDIWQPESKGEAVATTPPVETAAPVASSAAPVVTASASASASGSAKKPPPPKPKSSTSAAPTPKASGSTK